MASFSYPEKQKTPVKTEVRRRPGYPQSLGGLCPTLPPMSTGILGRIGRFLSVVFILFLGWLTPIHAISPVIVPEEVTQIVAPASQATAAIRDQLTAYRPNGPPIQVKQQSLNPGVHRGIWVVVFDGDVPSAVVLQYAYAGGDPVNRWDPSGLDWIWNGGDWEWNRKWDGKDNMALEKMPDYVQIKPPVDISKSNTVIGKSYYDTNVKWDVNFVARQFGGNSQDDFLKNKQSFTNKNLGHGYLMIKWNIWGQTGVDSTYSWHPGEWPLSNPSAPLTDIPAQINNVLDGNEPRYGRIWKNDLVDMYLKFGVDGSLGNKQIKIESLSNAESVRSLKRYIEQWIIANGVSFEYGEKMRDPLFPKNEIGAVNMRKLGTKYWVYGQNCFWWAMTTATRVSGNKITPNERKEIEIFNFGVGVNKRVAHNDGIRREIAMRSNQGMNIFRGLIGQEKSTNYAMGHSPITPLWIPINQNYDFNPLEDSSSNSMRLSGFIESYSVNPSERTADSILEYIRK